MHKSQRWVRVDVGRCVAALGCPPSTSDSVAVRLFPEEIGNIEKNNNSVVLAPSSQPQECLRALFSMLAALATKLVAIR